MKMVLLSFAGLVLCLAGIYLMYVFLTGLDANTTIFLLIGSLILIVGGITLLVFAQKSDTMILQRAGKEESEKKFEPIAVNTGKDEGLAKQIDQNNAMMKDWEKTNETKQRLRMLQMQASAEDGS